MNMRALRGDRSDTDQAFEAEDGLPGGALETEDAAGQGQADPELNYRPWWKVQADEMHEVIHRFAEAQHQARSQQNTGKGKLFYGIFKRSRQLICCRSTQPWGNATLQHTMCAQCRRIAAGHGNPECYSAISQGRTFQTSTQSSLRATFTRENS